MDRTITHSLPADQHDAKRAELIAVADRENEGYPQYLGAFDDYELAVAVEPIRSRWGDPMLSPGEFVLVRPRDRRPHGSDALGYRTIYVDAAHHWAKSIEGRADEPTSGWNCAVSPHLIRVVDRIEVDA